MSVTPAEDENSFIALPLESLADISIAEVPTNCFPGVEIASDGSCFVLIVPQF